MDKRPSYQSFFPRRRDASRCFSDNYLRPFWSEVPSASPERGKGGKELSSGDRQLISVRSPQFPSRQDNQQPLQLRP